MHGVLTELFGARPLYPNVDAHAIIYQVVIEKIMPKYDDLLIQEEPHTNMVYILRMLFDL